MKKSALLLTSLLMQVAVLNTAHAQKDDDPSQKDHEYSFEESCGARSALNYLPEGLTGKGVLVGVIDDGIEFTHVNFLDPKTFQTRIKTAFEVHRDGQSTIARTPEEIEKLKPTNTAHGTHVSGIAAGSYAADGWHGIAPEADLCLAAAVISPSTTSFSLKNFFAVADSLGLPAVINMSFGPTSTGMDGYDDVQYLCEELTENGTHPGRIIVVASGNNGSTKLCDEVTIGSEGILHIALDNPYDVYANMLQTFSFEVPKANELKFRFYLYDKAAKTEVKEGLLDADGNQVDYSSLDQYMTFVENDKSPYLYYDLKYFDEVKFASEDIVLCVEVTGSAGTKLSYLRGAINIEDNDRFSVVKPVYSVRNAVSMTPAVISVGNYDPHVPGRTPIHSKSSFGFNKYGEKIPDVVAPGTGIISSTKLGDSKGDKYASRDITMPDGNVQTFIWQTMTGTSQAAPLVAGVIALMLQHDPTLTVNRVRELLHSTNDWNDDCDNAPMGPDQAGHGILNAKALFEALMGPTAIEAVAAEAADNAIYDLFGRRLNEVPEKGIFIRNNKKIAK